MNLALLIPCAVAFGAVIGSFLTVVADRVPEGRSINSPPSMCPNCGLRLGVRDLVPIVSWVALRGRCRRCGVRIGLEPLLIELANVAVWVALALRFHGDLDAGTDSVALLPAYLVFGSTLVALSAIDFRLHLLPREVTFVGLGLGSALLIVGALVIGEPERIWMAALGAAIAFAILWTIYTAASWRYGEGVGFGWGDVILSPLLGAFVGFLNPGVVPPAIFFGFILATVATIPLLATRRADGATALPFGPFLGLGALVALFVGQHFVDLVLAR
ncbi:MAG: prepilin peptidase [Actinomycetota bacterium]